jgi:hypothetical protein
MTTTPPKTVHMALYDGFRLGNLVRDGAHQQRRLATRTRQLPKRHRGREPEPVTSMAACELLPRRRFRRTTCRVRVRERASRHLS